MSHTTLATSAQLKQTTKALEANGFKVVVTDNAAAAKQAALKLIPKGAEVLTLTSRTLEQTDLLAAINESGDYNAVRPKLNAMKGDAGKKTEQRKLGAAPDYAIGSVHAVSQDGKVLIASATGSQLAPYAYGADQIIWVVSTQKIVADIVGAFARLEEHVFPLENERAKVAYGSGSSINKVLVYNKEPYGRITIILVKEALGF